jgi:ERCC4-related helicase
MDAATEFQTGSLVKTRGREWVVLPDTREDILRLRPLGGSDDDATVIYLPLEAQQPVAATFDLPDPQKVGNQTAALILRDSLRLKLRSGAGPFRSFGNITVEPRAYQLVPMLMALKQDTVRLLVSDDVGVGKTIEACLIARELLDRGEIEHLSVICPPHLCDQWRQELAEKFNIQAVVVRTGTASRLERGLPAGKSIFDMHEFTIVSLDYIKQDRRRDEFLRACPEFVIVDEAHTCVHGSSSSKHQRYKLLKGLAEAEPQRHMVMLTATPHSGDDDAFHNLLGLLKSKFSTLRDMSQDSEQHRTLRAELGDHFVQRRRADIKEWRDESGFPDRETKEATYSLTGEWGKLFDDVLAYAREMVRRVEGESLLKQRMNWWAALALLRCASSSPAAAALALKTRLHAVEDQSEEQQLEEMEELVAETVMDGQANDLLNIDESVPAGTTDDYEDSAALGELIEKAEGLRGRKSDPKLDCLITEVERFIADGFAPVIFCRYIATAHYAQQHLAEALKKKKVHVIVVTGELTSDQRQEKIDELYDLDEGITPILVATDCLSEGINLQRLFNAVLHYDLVWNPTRHEQREGRVDRFGQAHPVVRAMMLYGDNNPVDGAVLKVIIRKAEKIRKELGVSVPLPADNNKVMDAIMQVVLLQSGGISSAAQQTELDFGDTDEDVDQQWESAKERERQSRTIFAQRRLSPSDVLPEWEKAIRVFGGEADVQRFVRNVTERLGAPLEEKSNFHKLPIKHLPVEIQERLEGVGITKDLRLSFRQPAAANTEYIHRAHPLVATLAEYVAEQSLEENKPDLAARCGALRSKDISVKTILYLLRLRSQLTIENRDNDGRWATARILLSEECLGVAVKGGNEPEILTEEQALALLNVEVSSNIAADQQSREVAAALETLNGLEQTFNGIAEKRSNELLADHRRVREASDAKGIRYSVAACLPVDKIGVYVLMPAAAF